MLPLAIALAALPVGRANATNALFAPPVSFRTGGGPSDVVIVDVNSDGRSDLVTANNDSDTISVLVGLADGQFGPRTDFPAGGNPRALAVGDLNGDQDPDVVATNYFSDRITVLYGQTGSGFGQTTLHFVGDGPTDAAIGDFNGDDHPDVAVTNEKAETVAVLVGRAGGGFSSRAEYPVGHGFPRSVGVGDFNGDGDPDLAVAGFRQDSDLNGRVAVLMGEAGSGFGAPTTYATGSGSISVAVDDFNGDGDPDLAVSNYLSDNVSVLLGGAGGAFGNRTNYGTGEQPGSVAVGDLNGDGNPDLVTSNSALDLDTVSVRLAQPGGAFGERTTYPAGDGPQAIALGDLNADAVLDLAAANINSANTVSVLFGTSVPGFEVTPGSVDFGAEDVGSSSAFETVTVTNSGGAGLEVGTTGLSGPDAENFELGADTCSMVTLPASGTCSVEVRFAPGSTGAKAAALEFTHNAAGSQNTVVLTGIGSVADVPPTAVDDEVTVAQDSGATLVTVLSNDTDTDGGEFRVASVTQPDNGTVTIGDGGSTVLYTPDQGFCNSRGEGVDGFGYTLNGGSSARVSVTVTCADRAPTAVDDEATVAQDSDATAIPVLDNDADPDGGPLRVESVTQPDNGTALIAEDGSGVTYTPAPQFCNSTGDLPADEFAYTLNGGSSATVAATVTCANDAPSGPSDLLAAIAAAVKDLVVAAGTAVSGLLGALAGRGR